MFGFHRFALSLLALAVLVSASALASQSIEDLARDKQAEILAAGAEAVPREKLEALWNSIKANWDYTYLPLRLGNHQNEPSEMLKIRLNGIVYDLIERNAIKVLTPEIKAKLQLNDLTCKYKGHCTDLDGLYLPLNHVIFLDSSLRDYDLEHVFLHELMHAYQFTYRLPIDIATLSGLVQQGKLKADEVNLYLDYYYEAQANWKGMQYSLPDPWEAEIKKGNLNLHHTRTLVTAWGVTLLPLFMHASLPVTAVIDGAGWLFQIAYGNAVTNRLLPEVAKSKKLINIDDPADKTEAALILPELVPIDDTLTKAIGFKAYNFAFHRQYGDAIQKYYFGKDRFLFKNDRNDLEIYNKLHDSYYARIGLNYMLESDSACRALLRKLRDTTYSPLVTWLTLSKAEMETCSAYQGLGEKDGRADYLDQLLNPKNDQDPFHSGFPGTEGSRPGLTILPQLRVLPIK